MSKTFTVILIATLLPTLAFAYITSNLKYGSQGTQVQELQEFLSDKGYLKVQPTGNFYSLTLKAVKNYQKDNGIPSTGYVGTLTKASINKTLAEDTASSTATGIVEDIAPVQTVITPTQPITNQTPMTTQLTTPISEPIATSTTCVSNPQLSNFATTGTSTREVNDLTYIATYTTNCVIDPTTPVSLSIEQNGRIISKDNGTIGKTLIGVQEIRDDGTSWSETDKAYLVKQIVIRQNAISGDGELTINLTVGNLTRSLTISK